MAGGALPPGFPAIEIEGEHYWDGGLVSNTPLQWVVESELRRDTLAFRVDLWSAGGDFPRSMLEVITREKEIRYSQARPVEMVFGGVTQTLQKEAPVPVLMSR
jgi:NTE family protein